MTVRLPIRQVLTEENKLKLRAAIVGCGVIGKLHTRIAQKYGEICAVCDTDPCALADIDPALRYSDYEKMLDGVRPDVVHICTPHYLHADMVIAALERGINVLCEKPLCIRREDIDRILDAEKRSGAVLGVCLQNRYNTANIFTKDIAEKNKLKGAHGTVVWHRDDAYYASGDWRGKWDTEGGGVLINQALHTLDLLIWFCGEPKKITASVSKLTLGDSVEVEDSAVLICEGENSFVFNATNGGATDFPVEMTLLTEKDYVKVMQKQVAVGSELHCFKDTYETLGKACYGSGHEALIRDFYDCIVSGRKFAIDGAEGAKVVKVILAAYESNGKKVEII